MRTCHIEYCTTLLGVSIGLLVVFPFAALATVTQVGVPLQILFNLWESLAFPLLISATWCAYLSGETVGDIPGGVPLVVLSVPGIYAAVGYAIGRGIARRETALIHAAVGFCIGGMFYPVFSASPLFAGSLHSAILLLSVLPIVGALVGWYTAPGQKKNKRRGKRKKKGL